MTARERALFLLAGHIPSGPELFDIAAQALAIGTGCRWAGIGQLSRDGKTVETLSFWDGDALGETFSFDLDVAPCSAAYGGDEQHAFIPHGLIQRFPKAPRIAEVGARSYRAEVFHDTAGRPLGHVFVMDDKAMADSAGTREFFGLVAQRVGAELNRWRAESALARSEQTLQWFRSMTAATSDQMALVGTDYRYRVINAAYLKALSIRPHPQGRPWRREEIEGHTVAEVVGEVLFSGVVKPHLDRCFSGTSVSFETWIDVPGLSSFCIHAQYDPYRGADGSIRGAVAVLRDITWRRQQQSRIAQLTTHEALINGNLDAAADLITAAAAEILEVERVGLWLLDSEHRELRCHSLYKLSTKTRLRGRRRPLAGCRDYIDALARGRSIEALDAHTDPRTRALFAGCNGEDDTTSILEAPIRVAGELVGVLSHQHVGSPRFWQAFETTFADGAADLVAQVLLNRDRRRLEHRLHQAQKMESLGVLAGGIAHDFNNLLVGVLGGVDLALGEVSGTSRAYRDLEKVKRSAIRAAEVCSQLLAYAGQGQLTLETVDLSAEVAETTELLAPTLAPTTTLETELAADLPSIEVDSTEVRRVIMNLITNASEALEGESGTVSIRTRLSTFRRRRLAPQVWGYDLPPGRYVSVEVRDTGRGIDKATRARIFEPFYSTKFTGRGLGLSATLGIVKAQKGAIGITSRPRQGTTFRVYFPASLKHREDKTITRLPSETGSGTILLVDDEEDMREIAGEILERSGFTCLTAATGNEALEHLARNPTVDLIILDMTMPGMDGEETFDEIRSRFGAVPIVLTSGFNAKKTAARFADREIAGFLPKPFEAAELRSLASEVLGRSKSQKA